MRTEKQIVTDGAAALRHDAIQDRYRTGRSPDVAFGLASILDTLAMHWPAHDDELRAAALAVSRTLSEP